MRMSPIVIYRQHDRCISLLELVRMQVCEGCTSNAGLFWVDMSSLVLLPQRICQADVEWVNRGTHRLPNVHNLIYSQGDERVQQLCMQRTSL